MCAGVSLADQVALGSVPDLLHELGWVLLPSCLCCLNILLQQVQQRLVYLVVARHFKQHGFLVLRHQQLFHAVQRRHQLLGPGIKVFGALLQELLHCL